MFLARNAMIFRKFARTAFYYRRRDNEVNHTPFSMHLEILAGFLVSLFYRVVRCGRDSALRGSDPRSQRISRFLLFLIADRGHEHLETFVSQKLYCVSEPAIHDQSVAPPEKRPRRAGSSKTFFTIVASFSFPDKGSPKSTTKPFVSQIVNGLHRWHFF